MQTIKHTRHLKFLAKVGLLLAICSSCALAQDQIQVQAKTQAPQSTNTVSSDSDAAAYPDVDAALGEALYPNEEELAQAIGLDIEKFIHKTYSPGNARRDAHPKSHGCVQAELHIMDSIPKELAQGIFIPDKTYKAWIRFSNGSKDPSHADIEKDARGMAIKVLGVPGEKLLDNEHEATTQDFIMISHPVFFANDPQRYLSFVNKLNSESFFQKLLIPFALGFKGTKIVWQTLRTTIANPLQTRYWSTVPYQLGNGPARQAVKYSARPCSANKDAIPKHPEHNYLRAAMRSTLENGDACMELLVQPRTSDSMSVEDSMTEWKESKAPFSPVATLRIPQQTFDTIEQNQFCENLSFNPWHALPAHKPLGVTNRLRKVIYDRISRVRHEMNSALRQEPN